MASLLFLLLVLPIPILILSLFFLVRPRPVTIPIKSRHVLITGGSSGIGLSLAHLTASLGARLSILARNPDRLTDAHRSIRLATGVDATVLSADVRDFAAVQTCIGEAGDVDVLICNQGVFVPEVLEKQEMEEIKFMVDVNVMGTFHLIKAVLPGMKRRVRETGMPGAIAIMSSQAGQVGIYGYTAYSASKFALRGLAEALQHEVIGDNIHVSLIFPPDTETPGFAEENKRRPEVTNIIAGSSGGMKPDDVAKKALDGIMSAAFNVPCNFDGLMLSIATAGLSPQRSCMMAFAEVLCAGLMRFVGLCFQWNWFATIEKWNMKNKSEISRK